MKCSTEIIISNFHPCSQGRTDQYCPQGQYFPVHSLGQISGTHPHAETLGHVPAMTQKISMQTFDSRHNVIILVVPSRQNLNQDWNSEFGSNKERKKLLARILKILEKARKRLSRQNSTIKVRKCEGKRPEFYKKHINFRNYNVLKQNIYEEQYIGTRNDRSIQFNVCSLFTQSHKYTEGNVE